MLIKILVLMSIVSGLLNLQIYDGLVTNFSLLQVINVHSALDKFLSLIPFLASNGDIQLTEVDWGRGLDDVPHTSKLRVLTGMVLLAAWYIHCDYLQNELLAMTVFCQRFLKFPVSVPLSLLKNALEIVFSFGFYA